MLAMASARGAEPRTRSPRSTTSRHPTGTTSGCSRLTSRRASTRSTTPPSWAGCEIGSETSVSWRLVKAFLQAGILTEDGLNRGDDHRHPARRDPLTAAGQHRPVRARRALRRASGKRSARTGHAPSIAAPAAPVMTARPLRGRLRGHGRRHPRRRRSAAGRGGSGARPDGLAPVGGEDEGLPHRRGVRLPRAGASSAEPGEAEPASERSTPTRRRRRSPRSRTRCGRSPAEQRHRTLADLLRRLNPVLRGWCNYFRHGVSQADLQLRRPLHLLAGRRLAPQTTPRAELDTLVRRYLPGWKISDDGIELFRPDNGRHRRATATGAPGSRHHGRARPPDRPHQRHEHVESRMRWKSHVRFGGRAGETHPPKDRQGAPVRPLHRAPHRRRQGLPGRRCSTRSVAAGCGLVDRRSHAHRARRRRLADGHLAAPTTRGQTIAHSDHGSQYTSWAFGRRLRAAGLLGSMGSIGDCFDNSVAESFFGTLQLELLDQHHWTTRHQLAAAIFEWIECWYNPRRRHSYCDMLSPIDYETATRGMITTTNPSARTGEAQDAPTRYVVVDAPSYNPAPGAFIESYNERQREQQLEDQAAGPRRHAAPDR